MPCGERERERFQLIITSYIATLAKDTRDDECEGEDLLPFNNFYERDLKSKGDTQDIV